jgi:hypothetical protein
MVAAGTSTSPLENGGEVGVHRGDTDNLPDPFHQTGLECDMFDARLSLPINDLNSFFNPWNARGDTETLDWQPFLSHLLPQGQLGRELTWIDVWQVESDADASWNLGQDFGDFGTNGKLDMEPSQEDSTD